MVEGAIVINFTHLLIAGAVFAGVFFAVRYGRIESFKRRVKAAEMEAQLAEDKLVNANAEHEDFRLRAARSVRMAQLNSELAGKRVAAADAEINRDREAGDRILNKIESAYDRNDKAFQTILNQQTNNAAKLADVLVDVVKHSNAGDVITHNHNGSDDEEV